MTNTKSTKRALLSSVMALLLCFSMLLGTTYAWFTDSVTSTGNVIKTGTLNVEMYWAKGTEDPAAAEWKDASKGAIFNNDKWEPGYSEAKHIKISNEGTLALKYQMRILANGVVSELADVIDVYYFDDAKQLARTDFVEENKLGTLTQVLNVAHEENISVTIAGHLEAGTTKTVTLAFKMQEDAGNEYQNLSIGADFSVQILATQYTSEKDSFDNSYDNGADFAPQETPAANVYALSQSKLQSITIGGFDGATLDTGYSFQPTETYEQALESEYSWAHADFFVYADATVPANSMALAGYYKAFDGFSFGGQTCSETNWIGLSSPNEVKAGKENGIRLIADGMNGGATNSGITIRYNTICEMGNDGTGFLCGAADLTDANEGTTLTVELRLYKTYPQGECPADHNGHSSKNCETGEYIVVGTFSYTFGGAYTTLDDGSEVFMADDGDIWLTSVANVTATEYYVPDGVTVLGSEVFATNSNIKTAVVSPSVTDFGATGVSATNASGGAFKGSAVETVVLPEGMTEIPAAAFNGAKNLTSVNIPSTVDTIGVHAFRQTAITELTIPATVETISHGAFRDMANLTTVTVEGNVAFENYAFRSCPNLTSIYLLGDDVTFSGSQFATHSDNGDATGITIYVKNATVAARLMAAQPTGGYEVKILGEAADGSDATEVAQAKNDTELDAAIANGATTVVLGSGNYIIPDSAQGKTLTIVGNGDTVVANQNDGSYEGCDYSLDGATVTFENVTISTDGHTYAGYARCNATYNNCTINGSYTLYGESVFNNCTFNVTGDYYNIWTWGAKTVKFNGCTFNTDGKSILVYNQSCDVYVNDCIFNDRTNGTGFTKSALETGVDGVGPKYNIYINNTTVNGFAENDKCVGYENIVGNKNSLTDEYLNIVIDGVDVY